MASEKNHLNSVKLTLYDSILIEAFEPLKFKPKPVATTLV